jgi:hypothetical protein
MEWRRATRSLSKELTLSALSKDGQVPLDDLRNMNLTEMETVQGLGRRKKDQKLEGLVRNTTSRQTNPDGQS